jgi:TolB-like protein
MRNDGMRIGIATTMFVLLVAILIVTQATAAQNPPQQKRLNVAVLDFDARTGLTRAEAASLSDIFSGELVSTGVFTVVDRNRLKTILEEQGLQQSEACSQIECAVEVGKILNVSRMFAGTIGKVGRIFTITVQMIDVETAQVVSNKVRQHPGEIEELAERIMSEISAQMASEVAGRRIEPNVRSSGISWMWYAGVAVLGGAAAVVILGKKKATEEESPLPKLPNLPN